MQHLSSIFNLPGASRQKLGCSLGGRSSGDMLARGVEKVVNFLSGWTSVVLLPFWCVEGMFWPSNTWTKLTDLSAILSECQIFRESCPESEGLLKDVFTKHS